MPQPKLSKEIWFCLKHDAGTSERKITRTKPEVNVNSDEAACNETMLLNRVLALQQGNL